MRAITKKFFRFTVGICYSHRWIFIGCFLLTSWYTLLAVASQFEFPREGYYRHGWPAVHTFRVSDLEFGDPWYSVPWRIYRDAQLFYFWLFLGDLATALGMSYGMTLLWHLHCRNRKPWQISIFEVVLVSLVICSGLAAFANLRADYDRQLVFLEEFEKTGWKRTDSLEPIRWYLRPLRDLRLIGEYDFESYGISWDSEGQPPSVDVNERLSRMAAEMGPLPFLQSISFRSDKHALSDEGILALGRLAPNCTQLWIRVPRPSLTDQSISRIVNQWKCLKELYLIGAKLTDQGVKDIAQLPKLERLIFDDRWKQSTSAGLKPLLKLPYLIELIVPSHWKISSEDEAIANRRRLTVELREPVEVEEDVSE